MEKRDTQRRETAGDGATSRSIIDEEKTPGGTPRRVTFLILKNHAIAPIRKERLSPTTKARREASQNKFVEKGEVPDRVESFREVISSKNRLRVRLVFVKHPKWNEKEIEFNRE